MVFRVPFQSGSDTDELLIYILIEHQSTVDPTMGFRVLYYMTQIWDYQRREWESQSSPQESVAFLSDSANRVLHGRSEMDYAVDA